MTLLSASNASVDPRAGRPSRSQCGFSDCAGSAEASGDRAQGASGLVQRLSALRVPHSPEGLQPEPGPAHRARPQSAPQPRVRAAWPVLAFGFVALSCPGTSPGLNDRIEMWSYAAKVAPADGFSDLAMQVMTSPSKNYILSVISGSICILFLIGLMCGRITKRVTRELKDR